MTHQERVPVDLDLALAQWEGYVAALHDAGWETIEVPSNTYESSNSGKKKTLVAPPTT